MAPDDPCAELYQKFEIMSNLTTLYYQAYQDATAAATQDAQDVNALFIEIDDLNTQMNTLTSQGAAIESYYLQIKSQMVSLTNDIQALTTESNLLNTYLNSPAGLADPNRSQLLAVYQQLQSTIAQEQSELNQLASMAQFFDQEMAQLQAQEQALNDALDNVKAQYQQAEADQQEQQNNANLANQQWQEAATARESLEEDWWNCEMGLGSTQTQSGTQTQANTQTQTQASTKTQQQTQTVRTVIDTGQTTYGQYTRYGYTGDPYWGWPYPQTSRSVLRRIFSAYSQRVKGQMPLLGEFVTALKNATRELRHLENSASTLERERVRLNERLKQLPRNTFTFQAPRLEGKRSIVEIGNAIRSRSPERANQVLADYVRLSVQLRAQLWKQIREAQSSVQAMKKRRPLEFRHAVIQRKRAEIKDDILAVRSQRLYFRNQLRALNSAMRNATSRRAVILEKLLVKPGGSLRK
jgi:chromosome segregation ATPase